MSVTEIKDFLVLPVELPNAKSPHYIFFKKHTAKGSSASDNNNSLFLFNLPINTNTSILKKYFQTVSIGATLESFNPSILTNSSEDLWVDLGKLTSDLELSNNNHISSASDNIDQDYNVEGLRLPKNCGIVTFVDKPSLQLAFSSLKKLSTSATVSKWPIESASSTYGGSAYFLSKLQSQILDAEWLSKIVSQSLIEFDAAEQKSMDDLQQQTQLVDEDGFTLVVGSHRKTKASVLGKQKLASTVELEKAQKKLKKKEKEDFYKFQLRQKKKDEMNDLLKKFKIDQERVRLMTEKKRFRPY